MLKLAIVTTHPIQYYTPLFQQLAGEPELTLRVFYTWSQAQQGVFDRGFGRAVQWDIPLLAGYDFTFVPNVARQPGCHHFMGIQNPGLIPALRAWKPDALMVMGWNFYSHLQVMRYFKGRIPVYFRGDSTLLDEQPGLRKRLRRMGLRWIYRHIDFALYVGQHNRDYFLAHGLKEHQLIYAPHAVDNQRFADPAGQYAEQANAWRVQLGIPGDACVFLFAGKLMAKKDPLILLQAFQQLQPAHAHLVFVGNGELEQTLKQRVGASSRLSSHVHFLPFQNQSLMPAVYRIGDVFVLCSRSETWGLAVNEAMACGRPVVVSDKVGCWPDLVKAGITGWVFKAGNSEELKTVMQEVVRLHEHQPEMLKHMGAQAYQHIQDFDIFQLKTILVDIFKNHQHAKTHPRYAHVF